MSVFRAWRLRLLVLSLACLALTAACAKKREAPKAAPPVPVLAVAAAVRDVPVELRAIGNVEAYSTVSVKSLVAGELTKVFFKEGDFVKKGEAIFQIDPRPLKAALDQAEANLARDTVQEKNASTDAARYKDLFAKGMVSREQYDQLSANADALKAAVAADRAAVEQARVQLGFTTIRSPIDGRTGNLNVQAGNIVKANDTPYLVVITQVDPIYVTFTVPQQYLADIRGHMARGRLAVRAGLPGGDNRREEGTLSFVDNSVDLATGTIKLKGTFANRENRLWPGQFAEVVLTVSTLRGATLVPSQAVQTGQQGQYVFVIKPDMSVEMRPVAAGAVSGGETVIEKGLAPGERVVTDGQLRIVPGARVEVKAGLQPAP